jgi:hypothetical protein
MAMKKDDDKSKRTLSGKKPATFGGANSKLIKPKASAPSGPRAEPSRPMGRDASGSANFDRTSSSRATVSVGPATLSMGGRTAKSKGGMNMTGGKVMPKKQSNPTAKVSGSGINDPNSTGGYQSVSAGQQQAAQQKASGKKSAKIAVGIGAGVLGAGITIAGGGKKLKQAAKYIGDTKNRKARKRAQKAENEAMLVERNKGKATVKASKRTMEGLRRARKGQ